MEVTNCKDINGNDITELILTPNGGVFGVLDVNGTDTNVNLSYECCTANGFTFDPNDTKCYCSQSCDIGTDYKIILSPNGEEGAFFQIDDNPVINCTLEVEFDYLVKFNCEKIATSIKESVESLKLDLSIEKVVNDPSLPIPEYLESIVSDEIFNVTDISVFLTETVDTGILIEGDNCDSLIQGLISEIGTGIVTVKSFNSEWIKHRMVISDTDTLALIANENLKVVIKGNNVSEFSLLIDNVKLNRVCVETFEEITIIDDCPKFDLVRVVDNKKSWVANEGTDNREFN